MTTKTKQINFKQAMTQFKKYVATVGTRPVLKYVYYDGTHFVATNSHVVLKINADYISDIPEEVTVGCLYDPKTMSIPDETGNYPNVNRLIPDDCNLSIRINNTLNEIQNYIKEGNRTLKGSWQDKNYLFTCQDDFMKIDAIQAEDFLKPKRTFEAIMRHNDFIHSNGKETIFQVRSKYITNALATAKKLSSLSNKDVQFNVISGVRPIAIKQDDVFDIIVLPVRIV